jgi:hypothetical protein
LANALFLARLFFKHLVEKQSSDEIALHMGESLETAQATAQGLVNALLELYVTIEGLDL